MTPPGGGSRLAKWLVWGAVTIACCGITSFGTMQAEVMKQESTDDELRQQVEQLKEEKLALQQKAQQQQIDALGIRMDRMEQWQISTAEKMERAAAANRDQLARIDQTLAVMAEQLKTMAERKP